MESTSTLREKPQGSARKAAVTRTRLMLVHPRVLFRQSLAHLLSGERDFELAGECANTVEAAAQLAECRPDLVLFDFGLWREFVSAAQTAGYQGEFLAVAEEADAANCALALSGGVSGVFFASDPPDRLIGAIRLVAAGGVWLDRQTVRLLADGYPQHEELCFEELAERERAVLRGVLNGLTNRKIAGKIGASEATVKSTLQILFARTGVRTRSQLVRIMLAGGADARNNE